MMNIKPIKLLPAREQVAAELRKAILSNKYKQGDTIALDEVSKSLGVSVTPVREALQLLSADGLIALRPNKGAMVLGITEQYIKEHFELRLILEGEMIRKVCNSQSVDISEIMSAFTAAEVDLEENEARNYSHLNQAFHMAIWNAAGNQRIATLLSTLWNGLSIGLNTTEKEYAIKSIIEHRELLSAIKNKDADRACNLMKEHIERSMRDMLTNLGN
ncbi:GntR family transcriptional regulator [Vibrio tritonius]|uniref:GntR family transcriptional regulator n=1 Tax=Vibrio tritonius TaxID=1435069 RepID=A0ABS7YHT0_9VIBR|nr:GntR family transcriptional regulator [Vibrio tritonius]MCA2015233.1 GntR family transcriptional regulator [Vibrio tritonius]